MHVLVKATVNLFCVSHYSTSLVLHASLSFISITAKVNHDSFPASHYDGRWEKIMQLIESATCRGGVIHLNSWSVLVLAIILVFAWSSHLSYSCATRRDGKNFNARYSLAGAEKQAALNNIVLIPHWCFKFQLYLPDASKHWTWL